jgi:hypothetical protein
MKTGLERAVEKGVKFLNREYGRSWSRRIDRDDLNLADGSFCIIGQLEGEYQDGAEVLNIEGVGYKYGFDIHEDANFDDYTTLTDLWHTIINKLQLKRLKVATSN